MAERDVAPVEEASASIGDASAPAAEAPAPAESTAPVAVPAPPQRSPSRRYRLRFRLAYMLLAAVVGAAIGTFILLVGRPGAPSEPSWSSWKPTGEQSQRSSEIASHVSRRYRLPSGTQLVGVLAGPSAVKAIAIRTGPSNSDYSFFRGNDTLLYILCGLANKCAISEGRPTLERARLLRREALELALYTFKYVKGVDSVVAFMPPRLGKQPTLALYFRKSELKAELDHPLRESLPAATPPLPDAIGPVETAAIDRITGPHLFRFALRTAQEGSEILVLAPVAL